MPLTRWQKVNLSRGQQRSGCRFGGKLHIILLFITTLPVQYLAVKTIWATWTPSIQEGQQFIDGNATYSVTARSDTAIAVQPMETKWTWRSSAKSTKESVRGLPATTEFSVKLYYWSCHIINCPAFFAFGHGWCSRFWKRHDLVSRVATTKMGELHFDFEAKLNEYLNKGAPQMHEYNVPPPLVVGCDETQERRAGTKSWCETSSWCQEQSEHAVVTALQFTHFDVFHFFSKSIGYTFTTMRLNPISGHKLSKEISPFSTHATHRHPSTQTIATHFKNS